jgi:hypothetical protein
MRQKNVKIDYITYLLTESKDNTEKIGANDSAEEKSKKEKNNKIKKEQWTHFNTISDYRRDNEGIIIEETVSPTKREEFSETINSHLYQMSTVLTFPESIDSNLVEENGWIGFINEATLDIPNYVVWDGSKDKYKYNISLNKTMNNNKNGEFYDMYPDRSLYSFIPKVNKYRNNRLEPNWDYCLTYPYDSFDDNELVRYKQEYDMVYMGDNYTPPTGDNIPEWDNDSIFTESNVGKIYKKKGKNDEGKNIIKYYKLTYEPFTVSGLSCALLVDDEMKDYYEALFDMTDDDESDDIMYTLKSKFSNNLEESSKVMITVIGKRYREVEDGDGTKRTEVYTTYETVDSVIRVEGVDKQNNTFTINGSDLRDVVYYFVDNSEDKINLIDIRIRRVNGGVPCKYYFRKFKKINGGDINSVINKMGFSKNIYSDDIAQLLFNDDVNLDGLKDNLGRELSEIYLTIVKNNGGYKTWYYDKDYTNESITFSHCFGEVTSGIDMNDTNDVDYNIHKIHNVPPKFIDVVIENGYDHLLDADFLSKNIFIKTYDEYRNPKTLENNITIGDDKMEFLGDIVEFSPSQVNETVLENVKHRFNTVQREYYKDLDDGEIDKEFNSLKIDEIKYDDNDISIQGEEFHVMELNYNAIYDNKVEDLNGDPLKIVEYPVNIAPEGYFYQPHHRILLKEFRNTVLQGKHEEIFTTNENETVGPWDEVNLDITKITSNTNVFSYLSVLGYGLDKLWLYDRYGVNDKIEAVLTDVGMYPSTSFTIRIDKPLNEVLDKVTFETEIDGVVNEMLYLPSKGSNKTVLIGKSFDIYVRGDIVKIGDVGKDNEVIGALTNLNGVKVRGGKDVYYYMKNGVITELKPNNGKVPVIYESLNDRYRIYKPNISKPNNSIELDDGTGRYLWRELKEEHEYESEQGQISKYVFTNGAHYINDNVNFFVRRQDPDGIYGLSNANVPVHLVNNLTVDGYSVDNSGIEHYEIDEEGFVC